jgi:23S rRNA (adenine2503-C2)-methyltransferase
VNDSDECARELSLILKGMLAHVNLIPVNEVDETNMKRSSDSRVKSFQNILVKNGINATIRRTLGNDINASCGQLRRASEKGGQTI